MAVFSLSDLKPIVEISAECSKKYSERYGDRVAEEVHKFATRLISSFYDQGSYSPLVQEKVRIFQDRLLMELCLREILQRNSEAESTDPRAQEKKFQKLLKETACQFSLKEVVVVLPLTAVLLLQTLKTMSLVPDVKKLEKISDWVFTEHLRIEILESHLREEHGRWSYRELRDLACSN